MAGIFGQAARIGMASSAVALVMAAAPALAQAKRFNVPAQDAASGVSAFARQADIQLLISARDAQGKTTREVRGDMPVEEGLRRLLEGTGLRPERVGPQTYSIVPAGPATIAAEEEIEDSSAPIVVTGTSIRGIAPVGSSSITIRREQIEEAGYSTTEQFFATIPQNFAGGAAGPGPDGHLGNGSARGSNYTAASGVNLRGLGATSTLILVNGHRLSATGDGYLTDISTIPESAIERVEIVTDGASAIYGSDAVAGVVNFILRSGYDGAETRAKYGLATQGGYSELRIGQAVGRTWAGGGASITGEFVQQSRLPVNERAATAKIPMPADIYPPTRRLSIVSAGEQQLGSGLKLAVDVQYSNKSGERLRSNSATQYRAVKYDADKWGGSAALTLDLFGSWSARAAAAYGLENGDMTTKDINANGTIPLFQDANYFQELVTYDLGADGGVLALPAGDVRVALGGGIRTERWHRGGNQVQNNVPSIINVGADRTVHSAYGEFYLPLFGDRNALPGLRRLELSAALRYDDYSDFGATTNAKAGLNWSPLDGVMLRASYSESFRAASIGAERYTGDAGTLVVQYQFATNPGGAGNVPILYLVGGDALEPETAKSYGAGITLAPPSIPGLEVKLDYFSVRYANRIGFITFARDVLTSPQYAPTITTTDSATIRALVDAFRARGTTIIDSTAGQFGADPVAQMRYIFDGRTQNLARLDVDGLDVSARYSFETGGATFGASVSVAYLGRYDTKITEAAPAVDFIDVYGYPPDLSAYGSAWVNTGGFSATFSGAYRDSYRLQIATTSQKLSSFFTANATLAYRLEGLGGGTTFRLTAINLFDRDPPFLPTTPTGANYDPAVANPLGRVVALELVQKW